MKKHMPQKESTKSNTAHFSFCTSSSITQQLITLLNALMRQILFNRSSTSDKLKIMGASPKQYEDLQKVVEVEATPYSNS